MGNKDPEILAPAGSFETLNAALRCGADAVYVGGKNFSARNNALNFTPAELSQAVDLCHLYNAKIYLAVNTLISDNEIEEFCNYIKFAAKIGVDAFIVQDLGASRLIRSCVENAVLHGSTQMSIHTASGAKLLQKFGFARVVPARELDRSTIKKICDTGIEVEIFVHGALCMSVSGQCYMSAVIGSRSANRGCCGQACRLPFSAYGNKKHAALSLKDLSLLPTISEVKKIGVNSLKIEGRMKRPEYVASAVDSLKKSLNGQNPDMQTLRGIFSRGGFTDGYFTGERRNMFGVREKDDVTAAQSLFPTIHELYRNERKVRRINFHAVIKLGMPVKIFAECNGFQECVSSECPEIAKNHPTDIETLKKQLSRLGDTIFEIGKVTADIEKNLIVPVGKLNKLRRELVDKMYKRIISEAHPRYSINEKTYAIRKAKTPDYNSKFSIRTFCRTADQIKAAINLSEFVIVPYELLLSEQPVIDKIDPKRTIISPPRFILNEEELSRQLKQIYEMGFNHLMCYTLDSISIGKSIGFKLHGGFSLNVFNSFSVDFLQELGLEDFTVSFEAKITQISSIQHIIPMGGIIFGRLPLMLTINCPIKNEIGCAKCCGSITDRTGRNFPVVCGKNYFEILNSDILFMHDKPDLCSKLDFGIVMLYNENYSETVDAINGIKPLDKITRGLYYRGIDL